MDIINIVLSHTSFNCSHWERRTLSSQFLCTQHLEISSSINQSIYKCFEYLLQLQMVLSAQFEQPLSQFQEHSSFETTSTSAF